MTRVSQLRVDLRPLGDLLHGPGLRASRTTRTSRTSTLGRFSIGSSSERFSRSRFNRRVGLRPRAYAYVPFSLLDCAPARQSRDA
jgi:hypothetical protein